MGLCHLFCLGYGVSPSERLDSIVYLVLSSSLIYITIFGVGREERCCCSVIPHFASHMDCFGAYSFSLSHAWWLCTGPQQYREPLLWEVHPILVAALPEPKELQFSPHSSFLPAEVIRTHSKPWAWERVFLHSPLLPPNSWSQLRSRLGHKACFWIFLHCFFPVCFCFLPLHLWLAFDHSSIVSLSFLAFSHCFLDSFPISSPPVSLCSSDPHHWCPLFSLTAPGSWAAQISSSLPIFSHHSCRFFLSPGLLLILLLLLFIVSLHYFTSLF